MAENPKIEFFRILLNPKKKTKKTFRDFIIDEFNYDSKISNDDAFIKNFSHFIKKIDLEHSKSERLKKTITIIKDTKTNPFYSKKPKPSKLQNIFSGVINGGPYDKDAIVADVIDKTKSKRLGRNNSILLPYYVFAYLPSDHSEGLFIIHSNSKQETITRMVKKYFGDMFSGQNYHRPKITPYVPLNLQKEFKKDSIVKNLQFNTTVVDNDVINNNIMIKPNEYEIKIEIIPKKTSINITDANKLLNFCKEKLINLGKNKIKLDDFSQTKMTAKNTQSKKEKIFEWSTRDSKFTPTVYLINRVKIKGGLPDFDELDKFCKKLFNNEILKELRPDKNASKIS